MEGDDGTLVDLRCIQARSRSNGGKYARVEEIFLTLPWTLLLQAAKINFAED